MANTQGYENVILPSLFGSPGEAMQNAINQKERQREFNLNLELQNRELANKEAERKQAEDWRKMQFVENTADASKYLTGIQKIDFLSNKMISDVYKKYVVAAPDMSMSELAYRINTEMQPIIQGDNAAKTMYQNELKKLNDVSQKNKNVDISKLQDDILTGIGNDFVTQDQQGNLRYNPIDKVNLQKDYTGSFLSSPDSWKYSLGAGDLIKELQNLKGDKRTAYTGSTGGVLSQWEGNITPYQEMSEEPNETGFVKGAPKFNIKADQYNTITDAKGNPMKLLRQDAFDELTGSEDKKMQFNYLWNNYKNQLGLKTDGQSEDVLKRAFAYKLVESNVQNQMQIINKTHLEPYKYLYGDYGSSPQNAVVNDLYSSIYDKVQKNNPTGNINGQVTRFNSLNADEQNVIKDLIKDNPNYHGGNIILQMNPTGHIEVHKANDENYIPGRGFHLDVKSLISTLPKKGTNIVATPGTPGKQKAIREGGQEQPMQQKTYHYNGKTYTQSQIEKGAAHYGISVDEYLKQLGIQ